MLVKTASSRSIPGLGWRRSSIGETIPRVRPVQHLDIRRRRVIFRKEDEWTGRHMLGVWQRHASFLSLRASARLLQARLFKAVFFFVSFPRRGRLKEIDFT